jgi:hypothetical protein
MDMVEPSFDHSTFTGNRERLLDAHVSRQFLDTEGLSNIRNS